MTIIQLIQLRLDQNRSNPQGDAVAVLSELLDAAVPLQEMEKAREKRDLSDLFERVFAALGEES